MSETPREKTLAYLQSHNVMTLATTGPEGVWAAAVFYVNDEFSLYFLSAPTTRHSRNIAVNPSIAATVQEDYKAWSQIKGIQLEGQACQIQGDERAYAISRYGLKYPMIGNLAKAPMAIAKAMSRVVWYKVVPQRLYIIDNSISLGHRDEVPL